MDMGDTDIARTGTVMGLTDTTELQLMVVIPGVKLELVMVPIVEQGMRGTDMACMTRLCTAPFTDLSIIHMVQGLITAPMWFKMRELSHLNRR
jgi:hypothetical protein